MSNPHEMDPALERELAERAKAGDQEASHKLIMAHARIVTAAAKRFRGLGVHLDELMAEGYLALVVAAKDFDPTRGRFYPYASFRVRKAIAALLARQAIDTAKTEPLVGEPEVAPDVGAESREDASRLHEALLQISPFEAWILQARYGFDEDEDPKPGNAYYGRTYGELSADCGLAPARIAAIERVALANLRRILAMGGLYPRVPRVEREPDRSESFRDHRRRRRA